MLAARTIARTPTAAYGRGVRKPNRNVVLAVVAVEAAAAALAYRDLAHRGQDEVRGPKTLWRIFIAINPGNSLVYWLVGRRSDPAG
jgi:hypothetical protein